MTTTPEPVVAAAAVQPGASYLDWGAIIGGAVVAAAIAIIFVSFGSAVGLGVISPFSPDGASATTIGILAAVWFLVSSALAYYFGGYIAGRMRGVWRDSTESEVETRDAMHGVVVWALGVLIFVLIGTTAISSVATGVAQVGAAGAQSIGAAVQSDEIGDLADFTVDRLYQTDLFSDDVDPQELREQASRAVVRALEDGELSDSDKRYLTSLVASQTSLTEAEAEQRVDALFAEVQAFAEETEAAAQEAADAAQNAAVVLGFLTAGGFIVSLIAAWFGAVTGGTHRDNNTMSRIFVVTRRAN